MGITTAAWFALGTTILTAEPTKVDYQADVQPILAANCYRCHGEAKQRGSLRLDRQADAMRGGDSGKAILPGKGGQSILVRYVAGEVPDLKMPPQGKGLTAVEVATLKRWIDEGATWPDTGVVVKQPKWWSLQPMRSPLVPSEVGSSNPIDAFILAKLREKNLSPNPPADRRTLLRRLCFDLTGLPPTIEEVEAFVNDPSPNAYEKWVDHYLASPHYGERWARHWLDVVHFGESHGYDKDKPRLHAWPYRDYVIRAFNSDKAYPQFVREQLAGDRIAPNTRDGIEALGFIAAGPWDFIGHAEVPESKIDGQIARHLDRDDMVANTMMTFVSLTVQCAQCHYHKFDPIPQDDYYALQAVFAALDRADQTYYTDPQVAGQVVEWNAQKAMTQAEIAQLEQLLGKEWVALNQQIAEATNKQVGARRAEYGYHSALAMRADETKWVQLDLGKSVAIREVQVTGCYDDFNQIGAGFGFPIRYRLEVSDDPTFVKGVAMLADRTNADQRNPGIVPIAIKSPDAKGRYVRLTATRLASRLPTDYILAIDEITVVDDAGAVVSRDAKVTALDSITAPPRWQPANVVDGYSVGQPRPDVRNLEMQRLKLFQSKLTPMQFKKWQQAQEELARVELALKQLPAPQRVYSGMVVNGNGAFTGTAHNGGRPRTIRILKRGDVRQPLQEVQPGAISAIEGLPSQFRLAPDHHENARREALADWITHPGNPLTWRSIVNRMWRYHMGRGLVETPNDFGKMGQLPSHPELLDWLAIDFQRDPSLKRLHRMIVSSATYRQSSRPTPQSLERDADNVYYSHMTRHRLDAESIRDSVIQIAGRLDTHLYGPSFQDFIIEKPEHSPHYQYHLHDPNDPLTHRRSVYRFLVRSQQQPFMTTLDCADPSIQVDKRNETLSTLQALALLNNGLMLTMAQSFATRIESKTDDPLQQVKVAYQLAFARQPSAEERQLMAEYVKKHGWANGCRLLMNMNEFVFID